MKCASGWVALLSITATTVHATAATACSGSDQFPAGDGWLCAALSSKLSLYYMVDHGTKELVLGMQAMSHAGWIGVGVNGNSGMKGASMVVVREDEQNGWVAEDRHSATYSTPVMDEQQDVVLESAEASNGGITWSIRLPLESCDDNDYQILDITQTVIWAAGSDHTFGYHGSSAGVDRGSLEINFFQGLVDIVDPADAFTLEFRMPNVLVESSPEFHDPRNPYICAAFDTSLFAQEIPPPTDPSGKYHVTRYEALIDDDTAPYVHHMIMNYCEMPPSYAVGEDMGGWIRLDCESMRTAECFSVDGGGSFGWAVGGKGQVFPPEAGLPWSNSSRYFALQMHYYNPNMVQNLYDSSGFRLVISPTLRQYDTSTMRLVGAVHNMQSTPLEPGQAEVWRSLQIPASCLESAWTNAGMDEVKLLSVNHHAHARGTKLEIQVFRDGKDIGVLREEKVYDYQHQGVKQPGIATLRKGDSLLLRCRYDTSGDTTAINFGELTSDEMCLAYVNFYPAGPQLMAFGMSQSNNGDFQTVCSASQPPLPVRTSPNWALTFEGRDACTRGSTNSTTFSTTVTESDTPVSWTGPLSSPSWPWHVAAWLAVSIASSLSDTISFA